jgi:hypothetical protein
MMPVGKPIGAATAAAMFEVYRESVANGQVECEERKKRNRRYL